MGAEKVSRATSLLVRMALFSLAVILASASSTATAAVTTYTDEESFLAALGSDSLTHADFDDFESGTRIGDQISGVVFSSPNSSSEGYDPIKVITNLAASSAPNILIGGSDG